MGIRLPDIVVHAKRSIRQRSSNDDDQARRGNSSIVPKGHFAVYVGLSHEKKRFVVPISYLKHRLFQDLLSRAEEEFGFDHPSGALTIPCNEEDFIHITSHLRS